MKNNDARSRTRLDTRLRKRGNIAVCSFAVGMLAIGGATLGVICADLEGTAHQWFEAALCPAMLGVLIGAALLAHFFVRVRIRYRCPQCGTRLPPMPEKEPALHYYCAQCRVEWDTGWQVSDGD